MWDMQAHYTWILQTRTCAKHIRQESEREKWASVQMSTAMVEYIPRINVYSYGGIYSLVRMWYRLHGNPYKELCLIKLPQKHFLKTFFQV